MPDALIDESVQYGVRLAPDQASQFDAYQRLIEEWSPRANLVGNVDPDVVRRRHFLESIALGAALREREIMRPGSDVLDVGAGAGFPGVVLKIVWPAMRLTLIEATAKKTAFLSALVDALQLDGAAVLTGRAELLAHDVALRERFDLVVARAVAPLRVLLELALPFARVGGRLVTPKGSRVDAEVAGAARALDVLGGRAFVVPFKVRGPPQNLVVILKQRPTPGGFPRRPGAPAKSPL